MSSNYVYRVSNGMISRDTPQTMIFGSIDDALEHIEKIYFSRSDGWIFQGMNNADSQWVTELSLLTVSRTLKAVEWAGLHFESKTSVDGCPMYEERIVEIERHIVF